MQKFEQFVLDVLVENNGAPVAEPPSPAAAETNTAASETKTDTVPTPDNSKPATGGDRQDLDSTEVRNLQQYVQKKYNKIAPIFSTHYDQQLFPMVSMEELKEVAIKSINGSLRDVKKPDNFPKIKTVFPFLDLFALLSENIFKKTSGINILEREAEADAFLKTFETALSKSSKVPLDYPAVTVWAQNVRKLYFEKERGDLGKTRLEEINKQMSFYGVIKHLIFLRQKTFNTKIPIEKIPDPESYIADIFLQPKFYMRGEKAVPSNKQLSEIYDDLTSEQLVKISQNAYGLFKQQAGSIVGLTEQGKLNLKDEQQAYVAYIGAKSNEAMKFDWSEFKSSLTSKDQTSITKESKSFIMRFNKSVDDLMSSLIKEGRREVGNFTETFTFPSFKKPIQSDGWDKLRDKFNPDDLGKYTQMSEENIVKMHPQFAHTITYDNATPENTSVKVIRNSDNELIGQFEGENALAQAYYYAYSIVSDSIEVLESSLISTSNKDQIANFIELGRAIIRQKRTGKKITPLPEKPEETANPNSSDQRPFETGPGSNEFLYSLGSLEENAQVVAPAGVLYESLQEFANFLRQEMSRDWGGLAAKGNAVMKSISTFGAPEQGGIR